ncbi:zinc finger protein 345-like, partial [Scomber scombrus]
MEENQNPEHHTNILVKREESDSPSATTDTLGIEDSAVGGSNSPPCWSTIDIKQEKEEEEEQSISQRGDLLDFTDQDQNQNPEHHTNNPVIKREESDSPSATTDTQGIDNSGSYLNYKVDGSNSPPCWLPLDVKQEKEEEEEQSISQRGNLLDFTDQDHYQSRMEENQNPGHHSDEQRQNRRKGLKHLHFKRWG